jgi:hypothetical protein
MTTVPTQGAPGFRFFKDLYPTGRDIGLSYYPYSSIFSGLGVSMTTPLAAAVSRAPNALGTYGVTVGSGQAYLDGQIATLATNTNLTINPVTALGDATPSDGYNYYAIFLNPTRKLQIVALGAAAPTALLNAAAVQTGDMYATAVDYGEYFEAIDFFKRSAVGTWTKFDPSFEPPALPSQPGRNAAFGNVNYPMVNANNFTVNAVEKEVYIGNMYPPYTSSASKAVLRKSASLMVGTLQLYYYVLGKTITAQVTSGSTAVVVDPPSASLVNALVAASGSAASLALSGLAAVGAGAIASWNAGTRTLTLGAAASANAASGTPLTIGAATPANTHLLDPFLSSVDSSNNFTRP